jgi:hypothetical protein
MWGRILSWVVTILSFAGSAAVLYGIVLAIMSVVRIFSSLDKTEAAAFIAAFATIVVSVVSVVFGNLYTSYLRVQKENRTKKIPVYEALLTFMFRFFGSSEKTPAPNEDEAKTFMAEFNREFMVWGSDSVVAAWVRWRKHFAKSPDDTKEAMFLIEDLIRAIRRDLGHRNKGLAEGDILAIFINDIHTVLPRRKSISTVTPVSRS